MTIPGIGVLNATAPIAAIGQAESFARGRDLAAWLKNAAVVALANRLARIAWAVLRHGTTFGHLMPMPAAEMTVKSIHAGGRNVPNEEM